MARLSTTVEQEQSRNDHLNSMKTKISNVSGAGDGCWVVFGARLAVSFVFVSFSSPILLFVLFCGRCPEQDEEQIAVLTEKLRKERAEKERDFQFHDDIITKLRGACNHTSVVWWWFGGWVPSVCCLTPFAAIVRCDSWGCDLMSDWSCSPVLM